ncbi:MAG: YraN family protein [bacterium]|nr:YraN family protein [bacterium]
MSKTKKRKIGDMGEELASRFLEKKGYKIIERNYLKKWGEIDIVAKNREGLHFIEVKSLTNPNFRPEDAVRAWKKERMARAIKTYFMDRKIGDSEDFQIDIAAVFLDFERKKARIRLLENVIL